MPPYKAGNNCKYVYADTLMEISQLSHIGTLMLMLFSWVVGTLDFSRNNGYNNLLNSFLQSDKLTVAYHFNNSHIDFTYISPDGLRSYIINHLFMDKAIRVRDSLNKYLAINDGDNISDHLPILYCRV